VGLLVPAIAWPLPLLRLLAALVRVTAQWDIAPLVLHAVLFLLLFGGGSGGVCCWGLVGVFVHQVVHGKPYDNKSDIWALGCVLYEMCALCKPFDASNIPGIIMKIVRANPR
jgi:serine/threonine protein kinase